MTTPQGDGDDGRRFELACLEGAVNCAIEALDVVDTRPDALHHRARQLHAELVQLWRQIRNSR